MFTDRVVESLRSLVAIAKGGSVTMGEEYLTEK